MDVYASISGGGPAITYLAGGAAALDARARVRGWAGASAGAIVAACKAFAVPDLVIQEMLVEVLASGQVLALSPASIPRGGLFELGLIAELLDRHIGAGATLADARVPLVVVVTDLDRGCPIYLTSRAHPGVLVREAVVASSSFLCGIVPAAKIPSLGTALSPDVRLFGDGGLTDNTADAVWDGKAEPRVALRLTRTDTPAQPSQRLRPGDIGGILGALPRALLWPSSTWKSRRTDGCDVEVDGENDWRFCKSAVDSIAEWAQGYDSVAVQVDAWRVLVENQAAKRLGGH